MRDFFNLFIEQLEDMYSSETQIIRAMPKLIKSASYSGLKDALTHHLEETKEQVQRLERIFDILDVQPENVTCQAMKGLLTEASELVKSRSNPPVLDAAIICAAQKVEHYEIATYGSLHSFAEHLELDDEIIDLIQETLDEEGNANKKLSKLADGSFFSSSINKEAAEMSPASRRTRR